jgi:cell division protein FtsA
MSNYILGLDIGTDAIKIICAENRDGVPHLAFAHKEPAMGLRKGAIVDLPESSSALARALGEVRKVAKGSLRNIFVNVGTYQTKAQASRGIVAVSRADSEIYEDDVERVIKASQSVGTAQNRIVVHNITREFIVDGVGDITDPLGLSGSRLEASSLIIDAFTPHVKNVMRIVELTGGKIGGLVVNAIAGARAALSNKQKDLGVVLIDIGAGTTSMIVYEEKKLLGIAIFPIGASHITNDIAVGLKIPVAAAEEIKRQYGHAFASDIGSKETVDVRSFAPEAKGVAQRRFIGDIIEARLAEVLELVDNELKSMGKAGGLAGGAVVIGGGARMPGVIDLVRQELKLTAQIGSSLPEAWSGSSPQASECLEDPEFVTACGLALHGADQNEWGTRKSFASRMNPKHWLRHFMP